MSNEALLSSSLEVAVPLWIKRWEGRSESERHARAQICSQVVAEHGDKLLFKVEEKTAYAFNHLAEGLALLSFYPGGVHFAGMHWETVEGEQKAA